MLWAVYEYVAVTTEALDTAGVRYSLDPSLRKLHVKKTRVVCWPGGPKKFLVLAFFAVKHHFFTQIRLRKRTPQEAPVFLTPSHDCSTCQVEGSHVEG